jgi:hypothetical protein
MIDTLNIGKYIYSTLTNNKDIECRVYPLVADNDAKYPFIVYRRVNLVSSSSKDGIFEDSVTVEIVVVCDKYSDSINIATTIRNILERQSIVFDNLEINDGMLVMANEEFNNDTYIQRLQFNFKINNN